MKSIEPGCMAIVCKGLNAGKTVNVVKCLGDSPIIGIFRYFGEKVWEVDRDLEWHIQPAPYCPEEYLLRIDGYEDDKSIEEIIKELTT